MTEKSTCGGSVDDSRNADSPTDTPSSDTPTLSAMPDDALVDEPLAITLSSVEAGERVTIEADFEDVDERWTSTATFEADAEGTVDLTERAPVDGDYDGVRPMGLVQFASRVGDAERTAGHVLHLTARVDGEPIAETTVRRRTRAEGVEQTTLDSDETSLAGELYLPPSDEPRPAALLLHGSGGTLPRRKAEMLASRGVVALALRYVGEPEPVPGALAEVPVSYFEHAVDWLRGHDAVVGDGDGDTDSHVGVVGVSRGTEAALLTAAHSDSVNTVVTYAPSAYCWPGMGGGEDPEDTPSAWSVDDEPLPIVPHPGMEVSPEQTDRGMRLRAIFETCVEHASADALDAARLPIEEVDAEVLMVSGGDDGIWQATEMGEEVATRLRESDDAGDVTHLTYENAGHSILLPYHPTTERTQNNLEDRPDVVLGGTPAGIATADEESWPAVLDALGAASRRVGDTRAGAGEAEQRDERSERH